MSTTKNKLFTSASFALLLVLQSMPVHAYVGPGAGLSLVGIIVAIGAAIILGLVGFVWYPIKRYRKVHRSNQAVVEHPNEPTDERKPEGE